MIPIDLTVPAAFGRCPSKRRRCEVCCRWIPDRAVVPWVRAEALPTVVLCGPSAIYVENNRDERAWFFCCARAECREELRDSWRAVMVANAVGGRP